jgi:glycosyltransferase involved in cell wall biosynthesis
MNNQKPKIVVVTPIKNEDWILDRFLSVTSQFADLIIIADQNSTDGSRDICQKYPKVKLIENKSDQYDEASRQILLLQTARELVPEHKIILALDADEILAANAINTIGWQTMLKAPPGTVLCFEKPDLYLTPQQCIRYDVAWPLGYVDDGIEHNPKKVHSIRIPVPDNARRLEINDVKFLHYALLRTLAQRSKYRIYSVVENTLKTKSLFTRRKAYSINIDWSQQAIIKSTPNEWFESWDNMGIDTKSIVDNKYYWWDYEILSYFVKYGVEQFWLDDIWDFDWEGFRLYAKSMGISNIPDFSINSPPIILELLIYIIDVIINQLRFFKNSIWNKK